MIHILSLLLGIVVLFAIGVIAHIITERPVVLIYGIVILIALLIAYYLGYRIITEGFSF